MADRLLSTSSASSDEDSTLDPIPEPVDISHLLKEQQKEFLKQKEAAEKDTKEQLNLVFVVQAFLFGAEAVIAQSVQSTGSFEDVKIAVGMLYFGLPILGALLSFLSWRLMHPLFEQEKYLDKEILLNSPDAYLQIAKNEKERYDDNLRMQRKVHNIYYVIFFFFCVLWIAVFFGSIGDAVRMSPGSSPSLRGSAAPSVSPSISPSMSLSISPSMPPSISPSITSPSTASAGATP